MKRKCLGCGLEYDGGENDLCPRKVGNGHTCGCLSEKIRDDPVNEADDKPRKEK